jgi:prephenate dehydrogenase
MWSHIYLDADKHGPELSKPFSDPSASQRVLKAPAHGWRMLYPRPFKICCRAYEIARLVCDQDMGIPFHNIAIIGVGLIGGSLGLAIKKRWPGTCILGVGRNQDRLEMAVRLGAIDSYRTGGNCELKDQDLVILATPVENILATLSSSSLGEHLASGTIVTDVGSTKRAICEKAWETWPDHAEFIGGHPVAGRETLGVENSDADLFVNAPYVICPRDETGSDSVERLRFLAEAIGAQPVIMSAQEHDIAMSYVSHLPQIISTALAGLSLPEHVAVSGSGFRDMVRLAGSPYAIWESIFATNNENIDRALDVFIERLQMMRSALRDKGLAEQFSKAAEVFRMVNRRH